MERAAKNAGCVTGLLLQAPCCLPVSWSGHHEQLLLLRCSLFLPKEARCICRQTTCKGCPTPTPLLYILQMTAGPADEHS